MSSKIRSCFTSRFPDGVLLELDFSQLEIVALAALSKDPQLIKDLNEGFDTHSYYASKLFLYPSLEAFLLALKGGLPSAAKHRRIAKVCSFQLQYGAGPAKMSQSLGIPKKTASEFIKLYYERYPKVKEYQEEMFNQVEAAKTQNLELSTPMDPICESVITSVTGRKYYFREEKFGEEISFRPTQIKNYPVQGLATADIVPFAIGLLYEFLGNHNAHDGVLFINTVHDSVQFDCKNEGVAKQFEDLLKEMFLPVLTTKVEVWYGIDLPVPLKATIKIGKSLGELK